MDKPICRILLVDDHADTLKVMDRLLTLQGYAVTCAASVTSAVQCATIQEFDLLIADLILPDGSGHELIKKISHRQGIPAIALTGLGMATDVEAGHQSGFAEYILKPVSMDTLAKAIEKVIAKNGAPCEPRRPAKIPASASTR